MNQVQTNKGLIDRDKLTTKDFFNEGDNHRAIRTEWYDETGEMVRADVAVSILRGQAVGCEQAAIG